MTSDATILRLIMSQAFAVFLLTILIPLNPPRRRNRWWIVLGAGIITLINALVITHIGLPFYIRFYFLTLVVPYVALFYYFALYKGAKLIFGLLSVQVMGNVAIINGLFVSYYFYGENHPLADTLARILTYIIFLPVVFIYIRPTYLKMLDMLNRGWWVLNSALIVSYALAYYILFVPDAIFARPEQFAHAYIGIILSLLIYAIIFFLFVEVQSKMSLERDKERLFTEYASLEAHSNKISTIAYIDALTGLKNRYALFRQMEQLIEQKALFYVVFLDLDNLKAINDAYDHTQGDLYLRQFALALRTSLKDQGEAYRFAGDEFVCLVMDECGLFNKAHFKTRIGKAIVMDIPFQGFSLGLACYPEDGLNADDLISEADQAMYKEKKAKKSSNH